MTSSSWTVGCPISWLFLMCFGCPRSPHSETEMQAPSDFREHDFFAENFPATLLGTITYPLPRHFLKMTLRLSFSRDGICDRSLEGI